MSDTLDTKIENLLAGLPTDLKRAVQKKVDFYKTKQPIFTAEEIYREARDLVALEMMAYMDRRTYLSMYNRRYAEHQLVEHIKEIASSKELNDRDLYALARIDFDLNGLKVLNDLGGHIAGNKGLKMFAEVLNNGQTTKWLRGFDLEVTATAEGGDEFGLIIFGKLDLRELLPEMAKKYFDEVYALDASGLIDFKDAHIVENLKMLGIADSIPFDFRFKISCSVGYVLFNDALERVPVTEPGKSYTEVVRMITTKMFELSDLRAREHKSAFKAELGKTNPILSGLYARMSREVIHLEKEIIKRDARITELESKLKT